MTASSSRQGGPPPTSSFSSSSISATVTNVDPHLESQPTTSQVGYVRRLIDQAGITPAVLAHQYAGKGTEEEPYVVDFLSEDPYNPMKMSQRRKWTYMMLQALACLGVTLVSTGYSGGAFDVIVSFGVSTTVAILGVSLFVLGFAIGPLLWAPLSEMYGRQVLFFVTYGLMTVFNCAAAGAPSDNIAGLLIFRFFAGAFGSSPLTNAGGVIADMFDAKDRGLATAIFAAAPFLGPSIGPIIGGFAGQHLGWRWLLGILAAISGVLWIVTSFIVPETYMPVLLRRRAAALAKRTGKVYISKLEAARVKNGSVSKKKSIAAEFKTALSRPWKLLFREPIVLLLSLYMAIVYGTLYMMFAAFPIVFQQGRGWEPGIAGLAFIGITVGMVFAVTYAIFDNNHRYTKAVVQHGGAAPPEARLPPAIVGSVLLPVGLFWFAWTNGENVHWIVPITASAFFAAGLVLVFLSLLNYLVDSYVVFAASVLAANSVIRSLFGAAFPLFTSHMYNNLGIHWASSIPAFLALACVPFPYLFYVYGASIRMRCKYAAEAALVLERLRAMNNPTVAPTKNKEGDDNDNGNMLEEIDEDEAEAEVERAITREREERRLSKVHSNATRRSVASMRSGVLGGITGLFHKGKGQQQQQQSIETKDIADYESSSPDWSTEMEEQNQHTHRKSSIEN